MHSPLMLAGNATGDTTTSSDEYSRLHEACLVMARQPDNEPDLRARWIALAQASSKLGNDSRDKKPGLDRIDMAN
jgi:hypothetical protein